jgi:hypothetical protein
LIIDDVLDTIALKPVPEWARVLDNADFPKDYFTTFGAIVVNLLAFALPGYILTPLIKFLTNVILPNDKRDWLTM